MDKLFILMNSFAVRIALLAVIIFYGLSITQDYLYKRRALSFDVSKIQYVKDKSGNCFGTYPNVNHFGDVSWAIFTVTCK